jgi:predicted phage baseplate assembly protein
VDAEAGTLRFGDGMRGRRPPAGAVMRADYDYGLGRSGNVGPVASATAAQLPPGYRVTIPVRTWGGADAESVTDGERQVARYLQHRDRLVSAADFDTIARRTPGVELARVDVLPGYDPQLAPNLPGDAPGTVTVMIVPRYDPAAPDAPSPDRFAMDAVCAYLEPRRLVTTELLLRGPAYVPVWVSVGIDVLPGLSIAEVKGRVAAELARVLSPLPLDQQRGTGAALPRPTYPHVDTGWPLRTPVTVVELTAYVTRVDGVHLVNELLLSMGTDVAVDHFDLTGLQLPRLAAVSVVPGAPLPLNALGGSAAPAGGPPAIPVPSFGQGC